MDAPLSAGAIEARSVGKTYASARTREPVEALRGVSFSIAHGEFVAVVGPSGCGKSTLLSLIAGFTAPSAGEVLFAGRPIDGPSSERGVMFQDYALFPWRTVFGNIEFGPLARGVPRAQRREAAMRYIALVGLEGFEHRYPHELSGGMRQRCALARMLANQPQVWLMDEPLAAVDLQTRQILQDELLRIWGDANDPAKRPAVMFVTHGIEEAVYLADRIIVLARRPGRIKEIVSVDLPRPRLESRNTPRSARLVDHVWGLIRGEAERAIVEETT
jgi:NitT/TauT family transport system ATP-binding protein